MSARARIEQSFEDFGHFVVRARWGVILLLFGLTAVLGSQIPNLRIDNSDESFLKPDDPARLTYDRFKEQFGREHYVSIVFQPPAIFDFAFLERVRAIHEEIEARAPYVAEVTSLVNARRTYSEDDTLVVEDMMADWPRTEADLEALRTRVFDDPLIVDRLIAENERLTIIMVEAFTYSTRGDDGDIAELGGFDEGGPDGALGGFANAGGASGAERRPGPGEKPLYLTPEEEWELVDVLEEIVEPHRAAFENPVYVTGGSSIDRKLTEVMNADIARSFPFSLIAITGILGLLFRRWAGAVLPVFVVALSVVAAIGAMAVADIPFSITLNVLPALLLTVGVCDAIHILAIFYQRLDAGEERADAIAHALGHSGLAVVMTSLTTAAGLASFSTANLAAVGHLGVVGPAGVVAAMVYSLLLLPALLAVVPMRGGLRRTGRAADITIAALLRPCARAATERPWRVLTATAGLAAVAATGFPGMRFSHDGLRWFPEDDETRVSAELIDRELKGTSSLEVVIDTGRENGLHEPETLGRIEDAMRWTETLHVGAYPVAQAISLVDVVKEIHEALAGDDDAARIVPDDRRLIAQELVLFENGGSEDLEDFTDNQFRYARMSVRTPWVDALVYPDFVATVEAGLGERLGPDLPFELTGGATIFSALFAAVVVSMASSYAIALAVITPLLVLLVGNWRRGLLAMIPNLIPVYFTLAVMGWLDIPLDMSTLLIGGVLLGIAVDDTIHFVHKFNHYFAVTGDAKAAVHETLATTGTALLFTSLVLFAGFSIFTTTYLVNTVWFGGLCAFAAVVAFLADVLVAPALMVVASPGSASRGGRASG